MHTSLCLTAPSRMRLSAHLPLTKGKAASHPCEGVFVCARASWNPGKGPAGEGQATGLRGTGREDR